MNAFRNEATCLADTHGAAMSSRRAVIVLLLLAAHSYSSHSWKARRDRSDKPDELQSPLCPRSVSSDSPISAQKSGESRVESRCRALAGACRNCPGTAGIYVFDYWCPSSDIHLDTLLLTRVLQTLAAILSAIVCVLERFLSWLGRERGYMQSGANKSV